MACALDPASSRAVVPAAASNLSISTSMSVAPDRYSTLNEVKPPLNAV
jgi:hypothetical protein